jgi:hypothetical protein
MEPSPYPSPKPGNSNEFRLEPQEAARNSQTTMELCSTPFTASPGDDYFFAYSARACCARGCASSRYFCTSIRSQMGSTDANSSFSLETEEIGLLLQDS